ncbi:hypothetical protein QQF64_026647 [Cirrhinus molitorella]|uniref:Uncharacterized protein n=2 Tax=Cirrhinus molitorella TaxID=172907 RepID=A0AA88TXL1_9TELE|nr:hypothetical protein Q8A67_003160 [Cirrhinus molitorella]
MEVLEIMQVIEPVRQVSDRPTGTKADNNRNKPLRGKLLVVVCWGQGSSVSTPSLSRAHGTPLFPSALATLAVRVALTWICVLILESKHEDLIGLS